MREHPIAPRLSDDGFMILSSLLAGISLGLAIAHALGLVGMR